MGATGSPVSVNVTQADAPPQEFAVPAVTGMTEAAAQAAITGAGLTVGKITQQSSATVPVGQIISQNPAAGTQAAQGSPVDLVMAAPPVQLSLSVSPSGAGSVTGAGTYPSGETISLAASANSGYTFSNWTENGTVVSSANPYRCTASTSGSFVANFTQIAAATGSLTVTILPAGAVSAGARWSIDSGTTWNNSGATLDNVAVGNVTVSFKTATGCTAPASQTVVITANQTATTTGNYVPAPVQKGSLTVTILPTDAVTAGAKWSIDNGATWNDSGVALNNLAVGTVMMTFKDGITTTASSGCAGSSTVNWTKPADIQVAIQAGVTATATGTYTQETKAAYAFAFGGAGGDLGILLSACGLLAVTGRKKHAGK